MKLFIKNINLEIENLMHNVDKVENENKAHMKKKEH